MLLLIFTPTILILVILLMKILVEYITDKATEKDTQNKEKELSTNRKLPDIYYFLLCGEFITGVDAHSLQHAEKQFKQQGYTDQDFDRIVVYDRTQHEVFVIKIKGTK